MTRHAGSWLRNTLRAGWTSTLPPIPSLGAATEQILEPDITVKNTCDQLIHRHWNDTDNGFLFSQEFDGAGQLRESWVDLQGRPKEEQRSRNTISTRDGD